MRTGEKADPTAAVAVIGDEVLLGEVVDENLFFLAREIARMGADLRFACVLPDEMGVLARHLAEMSAGFDWVVATGGIGATHDDLTRQAVAAAFNLPLREHAGAVRMMEEAFGSPLRPKVREMALLPEGADLVPNPVTHAPGFVVENVIVLPGIPELVRAMFPSLAEHLAGSKIHRRELTTGRREGEISDLLAEAARRFPRVKIGSYPVLRGPYRVRLALRSRVPAELEEAERYLKERILR